MIFYKFKITTFFLLLASIVSLSPLIHAFSPVKGNIIYILAMLTVFLMNYSSFGVNKKCLFWCGGIYLAAIISTIYWQQPRLLLIPTYFVLSILVISVLKENCIKYFINIITIIILFQIFGSVIGTIYAYLGGSSSFEFLNEDGRLNKFYLLTLTNSQFENFIRPSGFFDEPGALSFIACFVAALRYSLRMNKNITWLLLGFGFITTSVAHLMYTVLHAIEEIKNEKRVKNIIITIVILLIFSFILLKFFPVIQDIFSTLLFSRLSSDELGSDRTTALTNAIDYLDINTFMFGLDSNCAVGLSACKDKGFENYGENPLTLLIHWGGFLSFPYYFSLFNLLIKMVKNFNFIILGIFLLLLQRPYIMSYGYSLIILLTISLIKVDSKK